MSLKSAAINLLQTLHGVVDALHQFAHPHGEPYAEEMESRLAQLVSDFERAVVIDRSRKDAADILGSISPLMDNVNGAATKGGLSIFPDYNDQTLTR